MSLKCHPDQICECKKLAVISSIETQKNLEPIKSHFKKQSKSATTKAAPFPEFDEKVVDEYSSIWPNSTIMKDFNALFHVQGCREGCLL